MPRNDTFWLEFLTRQILRRWGAATASRVPSMGYCSASYPPPRTTDTRNSGYCQYPELLAAGIGQALLTTAAGLSVAIPALIAYLFFGSRVDRLIIEIDALGQQIVDVISADAWEVRSHPKKQSKAA